MLPIKLPLDVCRGLLDTVSVGETMGYIIDNRNIDLRNFIHIKCQQKNKERHSNAAIELEYKVVTRLLLIDFIGLRNTTVLLPPLRVIDSIRWKLSFKGNTRKWCVVFRFTRY